MRLIRVWDNGNGTVTPEQWHGDETDIREMATGEVGRLAEGAFIPPGRLAWDAVMRCLVPAPADVVARLDDLDRAAAIAVNGARWRAENDYIAVCDGLREACGLSRLGTKLSKDDGQALLLQLAGVNPDAAAAFGLRLLAEIHEVEVKGGTWESITWHEEVAQ